MVELCRASRRLKKQELPALEIQGIRIENYLKPLQIKRWQLYFLECQSTQKG